MFAFDGRGELLESDGMQASQEVENAADPEVTRLLARFNLFTRKTERSTP